MAGSRSLWRSCLLVLLYSVVLSACTTNAAREDELDANGPEVEGLSGISDTEENTDSLTGAESTEDSEARRAWVYSLVRWPDGQGSYMAPDISQLEAGLAPEQDTVPLVVYLHGCSGFWSGTYERINWLASQGFAVIAPLSLAREFYPQSCDASTFESGLYRPTRDLRQADVQYAIEAIAQFSWIDFDNVFLVGLSEGAAMAATYALPFDSEVAIKARVLEGWTCNAGWSEYAGLATDGEPVLSLVGDNDPWYQNDYHRGDCGEFMSQDNGSESIVFSTPPLNGIHELLDLDQVRELVLDFLWLQQAR